MATVRINPTHTRAQLRAGMNLNDVARWYLWGRDDGRAGQLPQDKDTIPQAVRVAYRQSYGEGREASR